MEIDRNVKIIVWIDQNIKSDWNQQKVAELKRLVKPSAIVCEASNINQAKEILGQKEFKLRLIYVIVSGSLSQEFMDEYENILRPLCIVTANIIFTTNRKAYVNKVFAQDPFFNPGGIVSQFESVIKYINEDQTEFKKALSQNFDKTTSGENQGYGTSFETVKNLEKLAYPAMLGQVIKESSVKLGHFNKFIKYICTSNWELPDQKLSKEDPIRYARPSAEKDIRLPYYLYAKFFIYLYSLESRFYQELNKELSLKKYELFRPFIYSFYFALKEGSLKSYKEKEIYRGSWMSEDEYQKLIKCLEDANMNERNPDESMKYTIGNTNVSLATFTANTFLSFGKDKRFVYNNFNITFHIKVSKSLNTHKCFHCFWIV